MKKYILALSMVAVLLLSMANVNAATEEQIEQSITDGLAWLAVQQQVDGKWLYGTSQYDCRNVATTALVVLKFEDRAKELGLDPFDNDTDSLTYYKYADNVTAGLDYLFSQAVSDTNGVHFACSDTYNTGTAMMAVAASNAPGRNITTGSLAGQTYQQALQGMMDWMEYAQQTYDTPNVDACEEGGWEYDEDPLPDRVRADQSNTGYATIGLGLASAPAPHGFGLTINQPVLDRLSIFIDNTQDPHSGGGWYFPCGAWNMTNILKTGNLLYEMALVGDDVGGERVQDAVGYIENHWNDVGQNPDYWLASLGWNDSYQAMFAMMKGFEAFGIEEINVSGSDIDWFDEVSTVIVNNQQNSSDPAPGSFNWIDTSIDMGEHSANLRAAWALLTLERIVPTVTQQVFVDIKPSSCPNPINTKSNGLLPVAVLGTEDFDVTTIDPSSIQIKLDPEAEGVSPLRWSYEDVATPFEGELCDCHDLNGDGFMDLTLKFDTQDVVAMNLLTLGGETIPLTITGNLKEEEGGTAIEGQDCVRVLEEKGKKK